MEITTYESAYALHTQILADAQNAANSLISMCEKLKRMRDEKLYLQFGCETFGAYCESMVGIKERQAYTYISTLERLGVTFLRENQSFGITKLELISQLPPVEVAESIETLEGMTAAEIRELVRKNKEMSEQLSMFADAEEDAGEPDDDAAEEIAALEAQIAEMQAKQEELEAAAADFEKKFADRRAEEAKAVEKAKADARSAAEKANRKAVEDAVAQAVSEAKKTAQRALETLQAEKDAAVKKAAEIEKKASFNDDNSVRARVYFSAMSENLEKVLSEVEGMQDEQQVRFYDAIRRALTTAVTRIDELTGDLEGDEETLEAESEELYEEEVE